jgi:hypothetical protein
MTNKPGRKPQALRLEILALEINKTLPIDKKPTTALRAKVFNIGEDAGRKFKVSATGITRIS